MKYMWFQRREIIYEKPILSVYTLPFGIDKDHILEIISFDLFKYIFIRYCNKDLQTKIWY